MTLPAHQLPVIHRGIGEANAEWFERTFAANGWTGAWRNGVFDWHHYHTNTHEALGCYAGSARIQLGGPKGDIYQISAGDVVVIPAGAAHCNKGQSDDFAVVGAYPDAAVPDIQNGQGDPAANIPRPARDPVLGAGRGFSAR